jgi:hypothetical protein
VYGESIPRILCVGLVYGGDKIRVDTYLPGQGMKQVRGEACEVDVEDPGREAGSSGRGLGGAQWRGKRWAQDIR